MANMPAGIIVSDAVYKIMRQPFFRTNNEKWGMGTLSARWAAEAIMKMAKPMRFLNQPKQRIRRQPYFGVDKSAPKTIRFRAPNRYATIGEISPHTAFASKFVNGACEPNRE